VSLFQDDTVRLIWSYHPDDPSDEYNIDYHGTSRKGTKSIQLLSDKTKVYMLPDDAYPLDFVFNNVRFSLLITNATRYFAFML